MGFTETGPIGRDELQSAFMMNYSPQSLVVRAPRCGAAAGVAGDRKPEGHGAPLSGTLWLQHVLQGPGLWWEADPT